MKSRPEVGRLSEWARNQQAFDTSESSSSEVSPDSEMDDFDRASARNGVPLQPGETTDQPLNGRQQKRRSSSPLNARVKGEGEVEVDGVLYEHL